MKIFTALLGHPVTNIFFRFIQKNLFTNPNRNNFKISKFFVLQFWDPTTNKMKIFTYEVLYQNRVKRVCGVNF